MTFVRLVAPTSKIPLSLVSLDSNKSAAMIRANVLCLRSNAEFEARSPKCGMLLARRPNYEKSGQQTNSNKVCFPNLPVIYELANDM